MRLGALLAAGASTRFGPEDKLLALWHGQPLVTWAAEALRHAGCDRLIAVTSSPAVAAILPAEFENLPVPPGQPMSASVKTAIKAAARMHSDGVLLCLGDMPNVRPNLCRELLALPGSAACRAGNRRLPPAQIAAADFDWVLRLPEGDHGARNLIAALAEDRLIPISDNVALDIDRPADLAG